MASSYDPVVEEECDGLVVLLLGILQKVFPQIAKYNPIYTFRRRNTFRSYYLVDILFGIR